MAKDKKEFKFDGKFKYLAFISYYDNGKDAEIAQSLCKTIEEFKLPTRVRKFEEIDEREYKRKEILPKFLQAIYEYKEKGMPGDIGQHEDALEKSKYLILICSPESRERYFFNKAVDKFVKERGEKYIIPFIASGKVHAADDPNGDPNKECFPRQLLKRGDERRNERRGINPNEEGSMKMAAIKIISYMIGVSYTSLWDKYQQANRRKRNTIIGLLITLVVVFSGIAYKMYLLNEQTQKANWKMMENRARAIAEKAYSLIDGGDSYLATLLALEILPNDSFPNRPYTVEAENLLRESLKKETTVIKSWGHNVGFSPDGMRFIIGSSIWDLKSGSINRNLNVNEKIQKWHPSGKYIVATIDDTIIIRNSFSGKCVKRFLGHERDVSFVTFNPQGNIMVSGGEDNTIRIWNTSSYKCIKTFAYNMDGVVYFDFSENEKYFVAVSNDSTISVWDAKSFELLKTIKTNISPTSSCVSFSPNEDIIAITHVYSNYIYFWNITSGKLERIFKTDSAVGAISFCRDGRRIIVGDTWGVEVYDVRTQVGHKICNTPSSVESLSLSPNGRHLVARTFLDDNFRLLDLKPNNGELTLQYTDSFQVGGMFCMRNSKYIGGSDFKGNMYLWNISSGKIYKQYNLKKSVFGIYFHGIAVHPFDNRAVFLSTNNTAKVMNINSGEIILTLDGRIDNSMNLRFSDDGKYVLGTETWLYYYEWLGTKIWDSKTGKLKCYFSNSSNITYTDMIVPNKELLVSVMDDSIICLNNINNHVVEKIFQGHSRKIEYAKISSKGNYIASMSSDSTICIWDVSKGRCIHELKDIDSDRQLIAFSDDETKIASQGIDKSILVWDIKTGALLHKMVGHKYDILRVDGISFSPNGKYLLSSSKDKTTRLWEISSGGCLKVISNDKKGMHRAFFSPDGRHILYKGENGWIVDNYLSCSLDSLINIAHKRFNNRKLTTEEKKCFYLD